MTFDVAIIGAGIAGASIAAELAPHRRVLLIEAEERPGYHSTGRSAAFWSESYGGPLIQPLTTASGSFLATPPAEFSDSSFLSSRGAVHIADAGGRSALEALERDFADTTVPIARLDRAALEQVLPGVRAGWDVGIDEPSCADIDVARLHAAYLRAARRGGVTLVTSAGLERAAREGGGWRIETRNGVHHAATIVNAAGAWADHVARRCEVTPLDIRPYRRTIVQLRIDPPASADLPLIIDARGTFYFKPEAGGRIWLSPHDETPCEAGDCAAEELDVALAIDRLLRVVDWRVERVEHSWAGLRSFAPDRLPVYGFAAGRDDFFWFAGQGGFGIQTAPAAAKLAAAMLLDSEPHAMVAAIDPTPYRADRFAN